MNLMSKQTKLDTISNVKTIKTKETPFSDKKDKVVSIADMAKKLSTEQKNHIKHVISKSPSSVPIDLYNKLRKSVSASAYLVTLATSSKNEAIRKNSLNALEILADDNSLSYHIFTPLNEMLVSANPQERSVAARVIATDASNHPIPDKEKIIRNLLESECEEVLLGAIEVLHRNLRTGGENSNILFTIRHLRLLQDKGDTTAKEARVLVSAFEDTLAL